MSLTPHPPRPLLGSRSGSRRPRGGGFTRLLVALVLVSTLTGVVAGGRVVDAGLRLIAGVDPGLPEGGVLGGFGLPRTNRFYARDGVTLLAIRVSREQDREWTPYSALPVDFVDALISTEDKSFFTNGGVDFGAIVRAALDNAAAGQIVGGGSTITQQLVKILVLSDEQTVSRKLREIAIASDVAKSLTKEDVLELYVNAVFYGNGAYSPEAAARRYFGKPLAELSLAQSAMIAGLPKAPDSFNPFKNLEAARSRMGVVLEAMEREGKISSAEREAALAADLGLVPYGSGIPIAPWFVEAAEQEAIALLKSPEAYERCGCDFITTLDAEMQTLAQAAASEEIAKLLPGSKAHNAALVAADPQTGDILAYVGSVDPLSTDPKINGAYDAAGVAIRQPGSSWKPIDYLSAIEHAGWSSASSVWDVPTEFVPGWTPHNFSSDNAGLITIRQALRESRNVPAVRSMLAGGGLANMIDMANRLGIKQVIREAESGPAAALGTTSVTLREMVQVYSTIAALGLRVDQRLLLAMRTHGETTNSWTAPAPRGRQVIAAEHAFTMVDILRDNSSTSLSWLHGRRGSIGRPAIVKTGTASEVRDTYTMGGIPQLITGVWVGNADNSPMAGTFGSQQGPAVIWQRFMKQVLKAKGDTLPKANWSPPATMVQVTVCADTTIYGGAGWNRPADGVELCPFASSAAWIYPGFTDPIVGPAANLPRYGEFAVDSRNRVVDPTICGASRTVTGLLAVAELPELQADLEAWIAAGAPDNNKKRSYIWPTMTFVLPGDGLCVDGPIGYPSPSPSITPSPAPSDPGVSPSPSPTPSPTPSPSPTPVTP